jgi:hypothetical protein
MMQRKGHEIFEYRTSVCGLAVLLGTLLHPCLHLVSRGNLGKFSVMRLLRFESWKGPGSREHQALELLEE